MKRTRKAEHRFSPLQVAYAENLIGHVEERRGRPFDADGLMRIHFELQSPDEVVRAGASYLLEGTSDSRSITKGKICRLHRSTAVSSTTVGWA